MIAIIGTADSDQCRCVKPESTYGGGGGWNVLVGGRLQLGLRFWFPPDPRRRCCSTFLNLNWWTAFCMPWYNFLIMPSRARQRGANCPVCPPAFRRIAGNIGSMRCIVNNNINVGVSCCGVRVRWGYILANG